MNTRSLKIKIRLFLWKILGSHDTTNEVRDLKEQIKTLQFFLNSFHDIQNVPPTADEDLRLLQLCDTQLLIIIDKLCKKHNLKYWLDYGTLLGAYRHKGFIPWDDDTDISMLRSDYDQITEIINSDLSSYGITAALADGRIGVGYRHNETGIWVDIFPVEDIYTPDSYEIVSKELIDIYNNYKKRIIEKNLDFSHKDLLSSIRENLCNQEETDYNNHYLFYTPRFFEETPYIYNYSEIYPLSSICFEDYMFAAPLQIRDYLEYVYSKSFMSFPKSGVLHHGIGRQPLSTWAKTNNVNMSNVLKDLNQISEQI